MPDITLFSVYFLVEWKHWVKGSAAEPQQSWKILSLMKHESCYMIDVTQKTKVVIIGKTVG